MNVFISWSGDRSKQVASALRDFLPDVIQAVNAFMSESDIEAGSRWAERLSHELQTTNVGILCLTAENVNAPWLLFEAGALSKVLERSYVCPYLLDLSQSDVVWPLAQFHSNAATEEGTRKILSTINAGLRDDALSDGHLERAFDRCWPELKSKIEGIGTLVKEEKHQRSDRDLLEELVALVRDQSRTVTYAASTGEWGSTLLNQLVEQFQDVTKDHLTAVSTLRLVGTRELHLLIPRSHSFSKQYLDRPEQRKKLASAAKNLIGDEVAVKAFLAD